MGAVLDFSRYIRLMKPKLICILQSCLGIIFSSLFAVVLAKVFVRTQWKLVAPFLFAVVLVMLASRFGAMISVAGSLCGAAIFAYLMYAPLYSIHVDSESERDSLAWMILLSISLSYLLYPPRNPTETDSESAVSAVKSNVLRRPSQQFVRTGKMAEVRNTRQD
jgi:K+-sensing histidine kinase KdpD